MKLLSREVISHNTEYAQSYINQRQHDWNSNKSFDKCLLLIALGALCLSALLYSIGGLHTGFFSLQYAGLNFLPTVAWANITFTGDTVVALSIVLVFSYRFPHLALAVFVSAIIGTLCIQSMKHLIDNPRPPSVLAADTFNLIGPALKRNSTPSGHTATAFILAALLTRCVSSNITKLIIVFAAVLVGWSRVVCGVHWPVDVCLGASLGLVSAYIGLRLSDNISLKLLPYLLTSTLLLGTAIYLFNYDGDFSETALPAKILSATSVFYWLLLWSQALRIKPNAQRKPNSPLKTKH
ncbi:MAG: membrane-associated phospholipid phosphatase [Lentisphaeria bacterium]|jgi:membrane-associated phospholipid phosphatase